MSDSGLARIGIQVESASADAGNATPVLYETLHALRRLHAIGEPTVIDLRAIPFGPGDEEKLLRALGEGEIRATVDALGPTHIRETRYHGVWIVDYRDAEDQRIGLQLEIIEVPSLLKTPAEDIAEAAEALAETLAAAAQTPIEESSL